MNSFRCLFLFLSILSAPAFAAKAPVTFDCRELSDHGYPVEDVDDCLRVVATGVKLFVSVTDVEQTSFPNCQQAKHTAVEQALEACFAGAIKSKLSPDQCQELVTFVDADHTHWYWHANGPPGDCSAKSVFYLQN